MTCTHLQTTRCRRAPCAAGPGRTPSAAAAPAAWERQRSSAHLMLGKPHGWHHSACHTSCCQARCMHTQCIDCSAFQSTSPGHVPPTLLLPLAPDCRYAPARTSAVVGWGSPGGWLPPAPCAQTPSQWRPAGCVLHAEQAYSRPRSAQHSAEVREGVGRTGHSESRDNGVPTYASSHWLTAAAVVCESTLTLHHMCGGRCMVQ